MDIDTPPTHPAKDTTEHQRHPKLDALYTQCTTLARGGKIRAVSVKGLSEEEIRQVVAAKASNYNELLTYLPGKATKSPTKNGQKTNTTENSTEQTKSVDIDVFLAIVIIVHLLEAKEYEKSANLVTQTLKKINTINRRSMDDLQAKVYFYYGRLAELRDQLPSVREFLLGTLRSATLRCDIESQATVLNTLLRSYLHDNLYEQADLLVSKSTFPEKASNNQAARYAYYVGRIAAVQLDYTKAHENLAHAVRKAPPRPGFNNTVFKLNIIVELCMGDIPELQTFKGRKGLKGYEQLVAAVRAGDLARFTSVVEKWNHVFKRDRNHILISRLRHNVIKTGIRMISLAYTRISLRDICLKLHLESEEDAEYIIAKAIRDGVVDATLDHSKGYMKSKQTLDIYSTMQPRSAFHQRIQFCLDLRNESVKALRYPSGLKQAEMETAQELRERANELKKIGDDEMGGGGEDDEDED